MTQEKKSGGCLRTIGLTVVVIVGLLFALVAVAAILGPPQSTRSRTTVDNQASVADGPAAALATELSPTPIPVIGQDVIVDQVRWKVISAENMGDVLESDNQFVGEKKTSGVFVEVRFELENLSNDMLSFTGLDLVDDQNREFTSSSDGLMFIDKAERCVFENLNPNIVKSCSAIYEVPANAKGLKARVGDLKMFGAQEALIELGL